MKLKKQFENFYSTIKLDNISQDLIEKRDILERDFKDKFPDICKDHGIELNKSDIHVIDQGSYKLKTTINNPYGGVDRDIATIFPLDIDVNEDPRQIKKYGKEALKITNIREPEIKEPCVKVSYKEKGQEWMHIDFPLYAKHNEKIYLARGKEFSNTYSWEEADPEGLNEYFLDKLKGNEQLRRVIRYLKKWKLEKYHNSTQDHEIPPSIGLTLLACKGCFVASAENGIDDDLTSLYLTVKKIVNEFDLNYDSNNNVILANISCNLPKVPYIDVFTKMKNSDAYGVTFYNRLCMTLQNLENACNVESEHDAGTYVQKVFGDEFEVPEKQASDVKTSNRREHGFGNN